MTNKIKKSVTLSAETIEVIQKLANQDSRSFSQMLEILVKQQLSQIKQESP